MSKTILARGAALAAATMLALTACGGADDSAQEDQQAAPQEQAADAASDGGGGDAAADAEADADADADDAGAEDDGDADDSEADDDSDSDSDSDADAAEPTEVEIGAEFTDEETEDEFTIVSAVRDNPTEYYEATDNPDGEMVYLEVDVVPGEVYGGTISASDFVLVDGEGEEIGYAASADDEMVDAGYEYFDWAPRRDGEHSGYIPIYLTSTADSLEGAYVRPELDILGSDDSVPEFRSEFEVPSA